MKVEKRIKDLGLVLPQITEPPAIYAPYHIDRGVVTISGQPPFWNGILACTGKVGREIDLKAGQESAKTSALNIVAQLQKACDGDLDRVIGCVHMIVFVNAMPEFTDIHIVADGASGLINEIFTSLTPPTRSSLGCSSLPMNATTEVEASFLIRL